MDEHIKNTLLPEANIDDEQDEHDDQIEEVEEIEAYCVKCKHTVVMDEPEAVWTMKGTPGTRGVCPECGTTVFRMGKTEAHNTMVRPTAVRVESATKIATTGGRKKAQRATYINYAPGDREFAVRLATDLENAGIHTWIDSGQDMSQVKWAGGVHPALRESVRMVVVMSPRGKEAELVQNAWGFFKKEKKPIVLALTGSIEVPDPLRRNPRFDFSQDYKAAFRQLLLALSD